MELIMINVLEKIEHKVIDLIDVHQDILNIVKKLREENRDLQEKIECLEQEKAQMDQRLEKILMTMQEVSEVVQEDHQQAGLLDQETHD